MILNSNTVPLPALPTSASRPPYENRAWASRQPPIAQLKKRPPTRCSGRMRPVPAQREWMFRDSAWRQDGWPL